MLGLETAGFRTLLANEVHAHPCMTLRRNFPRVPVVEGSIRDLVPSDSSLKPATTMFPRSTWLPVVHLVRGFSTAGMKDLSDPRNTLVGDYIRIVKDVRPRALSLENVTGLLTRENGRLWENVRNDELDQLGYKFHYAVLHAANYGVPQMRNRLIVLGAREESPPIARAYPPFKEEWRRRFCSSLT